MPPPRPVPPPLRPSFQKCDKVCQLRHSQHSSGVSALVLPVVEVSLMEQPFYRALHFSPVFHDMQHQLTEYIDKSCPWLAAKIHGSRGRAVEGCCVCLCVSPELVALEPCGHPICFACSTKCFLKGLTKCPVCRAETGAHMDPFATYIDDVLGDAPHSKYLPHNLGAARRASLLEEREPAAKADGMVLAKPEPTEREPTPTWTAPEGGDDTGYDAAVAAGVRLVPAVRAAEQRARGTREPSRTSCRCPAETGDHDVREDDEEEAEEAEEEAAAAEAAEGPLPAARHCRGNERAGSDLSAGGGCFAALLTCGTTW